MLCNLSVLLFNLDIFMLILSIVVSLVHDHISYAVNLLSCLNICHIIIIIINVQCNKMKSIIQYSRQYFGNFTSFASFQYVNTTHCTVSFSFWISQEE